MGEVLTPPCVDETKGFIQLPRSVLNDAIFQNDKLFKLYMYMLFKANHEAQETEDGIIQRGEFVRSFRDCANDLNWTLKEFRYYLNKLEGKDKKGSQKGAQYGAHFQHGKSTLFKVFYYDWYASGGTKWSQKGALNNNINNKNINIAFEPEKAKETNADKNADKIKKVIDHLNERTGRSYRTTTRETVKLINGRLNEGYTVDDMKKVIDLKALDWSNTQYETYLRPSTLFNQSKFEIYINEVRAERKKNEVELNLEWNL